MLYQHICIRRYRSEPRELVEKRALDLLAATIGAQSAAVAPSSAGRATLHIP